MNWSVSVTGRVDVIEAFHDNGYERYWAIVIKATHIWILWDRDGGPLEKCEDYRQVKVKDICEDVC